MLFRLIISYIVLMIGALPIQAHKPNQAFFNIQETTQGIQVEAEFPWTLRNALLHFKPALEQAKHKSQFEEAFFEYLKENLILRNSAAETFQLKSVKELSHNGHSHQNTYLIEYEGSDLFSVENTLSFSIYDNQENYHKVISNNLQYEYVTIKNAPIFTLGGHKNLVKRTPWKFWLGIVIGGIMTLLLGKKLIRQS